MNKSNIRKKILRIRENLSQNQVKEMSIIIENRLLTLNKFIESKTIMFYVNFKNEVVTRDMIKKCISFDKNVCIPYIHKEKNKIEPYLINDMCTDIQKGSFGIIEPNINLTKKIDVHKIDLVIVPGIAFDNNRNRIGFGKGYYDKFLLWVREDCFKIGFAYDFQIIENIIPEKHDIKLDLIITEIRLI